MNYREVKTSERLPETNDPTILFKRFHVLSGELRGVDAQKGLYTAIYNYELKSWEIESKFKDVITVVSWLEPIPEITEGKIQDIITCPFCGENDFDHIGLKNHLQVYCEVYETTESI